VSDVNSNTVTINALSHLIPHKDLLRDSYLTKDGQVFRRTVSIATNGIILTLDDVLPGLAVSDEVGIYLLLNPKEMNDAINEEIVSNSREWRETVVLAENDNEYVLPEWVLKRGQVMDVGFRSNVGGGNIAREYPAPSYRLLPNDNTVTLHIIHLPIYDASVSLVARLRRYYEKILNDTDTTTLPRDLGVRMVQVALYKKLRRTYGDDFARKMWNDEMRQAQQDYAALQQEYEPPYEATDFMQDFEWDGPNPSEQLDELLPGW
jgi:hypothetical protein